MTMGEKGGREEGREGANAPSNTCTSNDSLCTSYKRLVGLVGFVNLCVGRGGDGVVGEKGGREGGGWRGGRCIPYLFWQLVHAQCFACFP